MKLSNFLFVLNLKWILLMRNIDEFQLLNIMLMSYFQYSKLYSMNYGNFLEMSTIPSDLILFCKYCSMWLQVCHFRRVHVQWTMPNDIVITSFEFIYVYILNYIYMYIYVMISGMLCFSDTMSGFPKKPALCNSYVRWSVFYNLCNRSLFWVLTKLYH